MNEARSAYEAGGGHLSSPSFFRSDPLMGYEGLQSDRQRAMEENLPTPEELFSFVVNGVDAPLAQSLQFMIHTTTQLQSQI